MELRPGRLSPERMYPAGIADIAIRGIEIEPGLRLRTLESGDPRGEPVILVHGWASSVYSFSETIPALAAAGYRVIACDLPGFGLSDKPTDERKYTTDALCRALLRVADAFELDRFSIVGHSLGGSLGLELAVRREPRLRRLALISAVGVASSPIIPALRLLSPRIVNRFTPAVLTRGMVTAVLRFAFAAPGRPTERDIDEYWAPSQFAEYAWACRACVHQATWDPQLNARLRALRIPVLVMTGRRDLLVRGTIERGMLIPNARVISLRDAGHLAHQECAELANRELIEFLRKS